MVKKTMYITLFIVFTVQHITTAQFANLRYVAHPETRAHLGADVTLNGDWAFIAAPLESVDGFRENGAVYAYQWQGTNWHFRQKIVPDTLYDFRQFGESITSFGTHLAIGSSHSIYETARSGAVHMYELEQGIWVHKQDVVADDPIDFNDFGRRVCLNQEYMMVAAHSASTAEMNNNGQVYVYQYLQNQWKQQAIITPHQQEFNSMFGYSLAINANNQLFVGAPRATVKDTLEGAVFVFEPGATGWTQKQRIQSPEPRFKAYFGYVISAIEGYVVIGAPGDHHEEEITGRAYIFNENFSTWQLFNILGPNDDQSQMKFGSSVALSHTALLVGARRYSADDLWAVGRVYAYHGPVESFQYLRTIDHPHQRKYAFFGGSLALSDAHILIGAHGTTYNKQNAGTAYFYELNKLISTGTHEQPEALPTKFDVSDNFPNPFNPSTNIKLSLPATEHITLEVFDMLGRRIQVVTNQSYAAGYHTITINAGAWASGTYLYRLRTSSHGTITKKMMLVK